MSNIKLVHSGGNSISITTPASNPSSNRTLTIDGSSDGNIVASNYGNSVLAYLGADATIPNNTPTLLNCNTEVFDIGGAYDTSNGRFTPNVAGIYWIKAHVLWSTTNQSTNNAYYQVFVRKNGTGEFRDVIHIDKQDWHSNACSGIIQLNGSSDYVDLQVFHNRGGDEYLEGASRHKTSFEAFWVRALT